MKTKQTQISQTEMLLQSTFTADEDVESLVYEIEKTRVQRKYLENHEDQLKEELKQIVHEASTIVNSKGHTIATWEASFRTQFDTEAFKRDYPEIYKQYCKQKETRRFLTKGRTFD